MYNEYVVRREFQEKRTMNVRMRNEGEEIKTINEKDDKAKRKTARR